MKKMLFLSVVAIVYINTLNAQWVCEKAYWGDKYTYNTAKGERAYLRVEEYYERETFLGTIANLPLVFIEKPVYDKGNLVRPKYMLDKKYITISFHVDGVEKNYQVEALQSEDFSSPNEIESYSLIVSRVDKPFFWYYFGKAEKMVIDVTGLEQYEFNMSGSSKAYSHVVNGKTPAWNRVDSGRK